MNTMLKIVLIIPILFIAFYVGFIVRAYVELGQLPSPHYPDPKDLGFNIHHNIVWLAFFASWFAIPIGIIGISYLHFKKELNISRGFMIAFFLSVILFAVILLIDPYKQLEWFMD